MASEPLDPLQALSAALAVPSDSKEQADLLATLRESLEAHPSPIPILCTTLIKTVSGAGDSLLKRWVLDLLHFAICRSTLSLEARTQLASQSLDVLAGLLNDPNPFTVKVVVQCFASVYPLLFRMLCSNRNARHQWDVLSQAKTRILQFVWAPPHTISNGIRLAAVKFMQRVILVQTRGVTDPRLQNRNDPNLSMCPTDHPFIPVAALDAEGIQLLQAIIAMLFNNQNPDILSAILNSWASLVKLRPPLVELVISTLASWTPAKLAGLPASTIKSVEKSVRILLMHISRHPNGAPFASQIHAALSEQANRMEKAAAEEKQRKAAAAAEANRKRTAPTVPTLEGPDLKRAKLESETSTPPPAASFLAGFDFTTLPATLVTDLIVANLQSFSESALATLVQTYIQSRISPTFSAPAPMPLPSESVASAPPVAPPTVASHAPPTAPAAMLGRTLSKTITPPTEPAKKTRSPSPPKAPQEVKEEPVDPLQMDIDEEEIEYEPDRLNLELSGDQEAAAEGELDLDHVMDLTLDVQEFKLPPPKDLSDNDRESLVKNSLVRIWNGAKDLAPPETTYDDSQGIAAGDMWMLLIVRLVTRVADPASSQRDAMDQDSEEPNGQVTSDLYSYQDRLRQTLCDYIMADFPGRLRLATTWMNEEWYNDQIRSTSESDWRPNYDIWLNQIVAVYQTHLDGKDRTFSRFLLDLPAIPGDLLALLREMCVEPERRQIGFSTLREFVQQRPTLRSEAMNMLLELTTHPDKVTRGAAINTVKRWIPDVQPMDNMIREFALQLLRRLQSRPSTGEKKAEVNGNNADENMEDEEDGQLPPEDIIQTPYLPEQLELPASKAQILQHVELLFALSTKVPEFLDEIFAAYGGMEETVQETIQHLITPLVRALGPSHGKMLTLLRTFPPGAETLALRVLTIFTEHGRPSAQLVALVKSLMNERELDARFLIPIIAEMDKADILRHLPKIVSILNGKPEPKNLVRSVFSSIVTTPPQTFGSVTSNLPRVRQSELLTPAELMVLLHESEKEIGLKSAIEAIGICFSMTDIYRSEILGVVMNQLVDEPVLPTLFLRTVIQAVTTYRSLVGFVSTTLLSRLITKKIWTSPPLWEGFIRCAKLIAPASFGALLQLPKDQLRELVDKQPSLKAGLREYVMKKSGNKARVAGLLEIFGEDDSSGSGSSAAAKEKAGSPGLDPGPGSGPGPGSDVGTTAAGVNGTGTPPPPQQEMHAETPPPAEASTPAPVSDS